MSTRRLPTKSTRWEAVIELGTDPETGKRRQQRINRDPETGLPIPTKREAERIEREARVKRHRPGWVDPRRTTTAAFLAHWLEETKDARSGATQYNWSKIVSTRFVPHIGTMMLADLSPRHIEAMYRTLAPRYTHATMHSTQAVLTTAMKAAVRWRLIEHNPAAGVPIPKTVKPPRERLAWTPEQVRALLAATEGDAWGPLWRLLYDSGLRIGEALALRWPDLDDRGRLHVVRTETRDVHGRRAVAERTKTQSGHRVVTLAPPTLAALKTHRAHQNARRLAHGPYWRDDGLIFDRGDGRLLNPDTVCKILKRTCAEAGVPYVGPHGIRRTSITIAVAEGVPLHAVSRRAGHTYIAITSDLYALPSEDADKRVSAALERAVAGGSGGNVREM